MIYLFDPKNMNDVINKKHQKSSADATGDLQSTVEEAKSSMEENLSAEKPTPDQKIEQLTDQVYKLTLGINEIIKLSGIVLKGQIESSQSIDALTKLINLLIKPIGEKVESIQSSRDKKIDEAVKKITEIVNEIQKKNVYKQRVLAKALRALLEKDDVYDARECIDKEFNPRDIFPR